MSYDFRVFEGDFQIGPNGDLVTVEDNNKLIQDILKIIITPVGSNKLNPAYGSLVSRSLIGNAFPMDFTSSIATSQMRSALDNLQRLQKEQLLFQAVSAGELLVAIQNVSIERNQVDPRFLSVKISVLAGDGNPVNTEFSVNSL